MVPSTPCFGNMKSGEWDGLSESVGGRDGLLLGRFVGKLVLGAIDGLWLGFDVGLDDGCVDDIILG